jgi:molybdopterin-biosynthesis enzyme MoeA-like protein
MEAIFEETMAPLLKQASGYRAFYEKSIYAEDVMESTLAPLIDRVMHNNPGVYVKSHPRGGENKPHMEIHMSTTARNTDKPEEKLQKTITQLSIAIEKIGGRVIVDKQTGA